MWESEFDNIVSKKDKVKDININQLKLEVHDTYFFKDEKITTSFEAVNDEDVINKDCLDEKLSKIEGHLSFLENDYTEFKLHYNKQPVEEFLIQRAVKTTMEILYEIVLFVGFPNADKVFCLLQDVDLIKRK